MLEQLTSRNVSRKTKILCMLVESFVVGFDVCKVSSPGPLFAVVKRKRYFQGEAWLLYTLKFSEAFLC